jgi:hypothetical protein
LLSRPAPVFALERYPVNDHVFILLMLALVTVVILLVDWWIFERR